ncbi:MAG TPA: right-handed parallel beta-helix repeat-containing protein, partial [Abditibacteriaceae bacterium]|nr:right-handed parallel beta-helix repeat-containing protein [Abditibacteriaceae bacterium]
ATMERARDAVRTLKQSGNLSGPCTVWLRGVRYPLTEPILFEAQDSAPVTYAAYPDEQPILDGGRRIENWRFEDRGELEVWVADIPEVAAGDWYFRQLFVNNQRRPRARLPKVGPEPERRNFYRIENVPGKGLDAELFEGTDTFECAFGDIQTWQHLQDVEVVVLHYWVEERMPIASFDETTRLVKSSRRSIFALRDDWKERFARYYVDNVLEGLSEPGEWYLERESGQLIYLPLPGETPGTVEIIAPCVEQLLKLSGDPDAKEFVEFLRFEGLTFEHTDWRLPDGGSDSTAGGTAGVQYSASPQAACNVPGAIQLSGARYCTFEDCTIRHIGWYAIELGHGCSGNRIVGNEIYDIGAGGVKLRGGNAQSTPARRSGNNRITDNHIYRGGRVFHSAVGVLATDAFGNEISHNHIHDFYYTAISCGWVWGYAENVSKHNRIEKNHIHDIGHGWLSDMGGIYTLGVQPGTVIRGNLIHDIEGANYGGWAIYPDEGSSHIVIENNICYSTSSQAFHQHYGRENIVRNNIFAFGREGQITLSRIEEHISFTFERNIVLTDNELIYVGGYAAGPTDHRVISDLNLFWNISGEVTVSKESDLAAWQQSRNDLHSIIADPLCQNAAGFDFKLAAASQAFALGFHAVDLSDVGPRFREKRDV